jgi:hypothetical protein
MAESNRMIEAIAEKVEAGDRAVLCTIEEAMRNA